MNFSEIESGMRDEMWGWLEEHLSIAAQIIAKDRHLAPMLAVHADTPQLISLQPANGAVDVNRAYERAVQKLQFMSYHYAIFSYSTRIGLSTGKETDAVRSVIFAQDGLSVDIYTPYNIGGLLKRKVAYGKAIVSQVLPNAFDS